LKKTALLILTLFAVLTSISVVSVQAEVYIWMEENGIRHISNVKPDWWTDEMDTLDPGTVVAPDEENGLLGKYVGDRENKKFHWPKCIQIKNSEGFLAIPEAKRVWFKTYQDAVDQGYYVCDHCKPSADGPEYKPEK